MVQSTGSIFINWRRQNVHLIATWTSNFFMWPTKLKKLPLLFLPAPPRLQSLCKLTLCKLTLCKLTLCKLTLCKLTLCKLTLCKLTLCKLTLCKLTLCKLTLCKLTLCKLTLCNCQELTNDSQLQCIVIKHTEVSTTFATQHTL